MERDEEEIRALKKEVANLKKATGGKVKELLYQISKISYNPVNISIFYPISSFLKVLNLTFHFIKLV